MATQVFSHWCAAYRNNPSGQTKWRTADFSEMGVRLTYPQGTDLYATLGEPPQPALVGVPGLMEFSMKPARSMEKIAAQETTKLAKYLGF